LCAPFQNATASMDNSSNEEDACEPTTKPNAFDVLMAAPAKKAKIDGVVDPIVIAVVYIRWLKWIDPSAPLFGCPYVGQAVRSGLTANEVAAARWAEENRDATREDKSVGLLCELKVHGSTAFDSQVVEWKQGPRSDVQKWADEREITLIAEHGGPLRDLSVRCKQTLNLDHGGKFGMNFESRDALRTVSWLQFQDEYVAYIECHGTSLVPQSYVNAVSGYKLGQRLLGVRHGELWKGHPDEVSRKEWLESLPDWAWNVYETEDWKRRMSARTRAQWANADEATRAEWSRKQSEARCTPEAKAAASKRGKAQAAREAAEGKQPLQERGKSTSTKNWTKEQFDATCVKRAATHAARRAKLLKALPEAERSKLQKKFDKSDKRSSIRSSKAHALMKFPQYSKMGYRWCHAKLHLAMKDGIVFVEEDGVWCARACSDAVGSRV